MYQRPTLMLRNGTLWAPGPRRQYDSMFLAARWADLIREMVELPQRREVSDARSSGPVSD